MTHRFTGPRPLLALAAVAGLTLAACAAPEEDDSGGGGGDSGSTAGGGDGGSNGDTVTIGVNIELSGPSSVQGTAYKNAVELVTEQINADGGVDGKELELVIRDNKSDPTEALQVAKGG